MSIPSRKNVKDVLISPGQWYNPEQGYKAKVLSMVGNHNTGIDGELVLISGIGVGVMFYAIMPAADPTRYYPIDFNGQEIIVYPGDQLNISGAGNYVYIRVLEEVDRSREFLKKSTVQGEIYE